MSAARVLVIFGTSYGQTAKIARRISDVLREMAIDVELCDAATGKPSQALEDYQAVVVGSSLIARGIQPAIQEFVGRHGALLNRMPSAFYMVSASAGSASEGGRAAAQRVLDDFLTASRWSPRLAVSMAGAINYTKYSFLLRWYMRRAAAKNGGSTDTSRDHELTDWKQVDRFAVDVGALVPHQAAARAVPPVLTAVP